MTQLWKQCFVLPSGSKPQVSVKWPSKTSVRGQPVGTMVNPFTTAGAEKAERHLLGGTRTDEALLTSGVAAGETA